MAVAVAVALFGALAGAGLVWAADRALVAVGLMLPVTLLAVTFGRRGGIVGSLAALALYPLWASVPSAIALVLTGVLVGNAVDAIQDSEQRALIAQLGRDRAEAAAERHRQATEVNDAIVQGVAVAKWALEAGDVARAVQILDDTVSAGQRMVSDLLG